MPLTLEVTNNRGSDMGAGYRKIFSGRGGTIGRTKENDWVLPSPGVSRCHATVRFVNGIYFLEDNSRNGISINGQAIAPGEPTILSDGDRVLIDQFAILVRIDATAGEAPSAPLDAAPAYAPPAAPVAAQLLPDDAGLSSLIDGVSGDAGSLDPLNFLGPQKEPIPLKSSPRGWNHTPGIGDSYAPPAVTSAGPSMIPDDWLASQPEPAAKAAPPSPPPARPTPAPSIEPPQSGLPGAASMVPAPFSSAGAGTSLDVAELLAGAGLKGQTLSPEVARAFGKVLRVVVEGMIEVLHARAEIKSEFRLPMTRVQHSENNPLKFAANVDDVLHSMLVRRNPAYLGTAEAFEDAFEDVRHHQVAMLSGVRAAYEALLAHFDPARLQQDFDRLPAERFSLSAAARNWERYQAYYQELMRDPDDSFRTLFGDIFARAYEAQLNSVKKSRKGQKG